jgi:hypothetical protein
LERVKGIEHSFSGHGRPLSESVPSQKEQEHLAKYETIHIAPLQKCRKTLDNLLAMGANVSDITTVRRETRCRNKNPCIAVLVVSICR